MKSFSITIYDNTNKRPKEVRRIGLDYDKKQPAERIGITNTITIWAWKYFWCVSWISTKK